MARGTLTSSSCPRRFVLGATALILVATSFWAFRESGSLGAPPRYPSDEILYDNIAFNLAAGNGFAYDFTNLEWQQPYRDANADRRYDQLLGSSRKGPTADKPPLWSLLMSVVYQTFGHRFEMVRIVNIVALVLGLTFLLRTVSRSYGELIAAFAATTIALDFAVLGFAFV